MSATDDMEAMFARVRTWPPALQRDAADIILALEDRIGGHSLSEEDRAALAEAEAEFERGEVASDKDVEAVLDRYAR